MNSVERATTPAEFMQSVHALEQDIHDGRHSLRGADDSNSGGDKHHKLDHHHHSNLTLPIIVQDVHAAALSEPVTAQYGETYVHITESLDIYQPQDREAILHAFGELCAKQATEGGEIDGAWTMEWNTWKLVGSLLHKRLSSASASVSPSEGGNEMHAYQSDSTRADHILSLDRELDEAILVKGWLEETAHPSKLSSPQKGYRPYTINRIKKSLVSHDTKIVSRPDPDAVRRQGKSLATEDQKNEANLHRVIFDLIRRGKLADAIEVCEHHDHPWKGATFMGGLLWKCDQLDTNNSQPEGDDDAERTFSGNQNRFLWKFAVEKLASQECYDVYERAIYGYLCGDITSMLSVCHSWEDILWAHQHALIEYEVDARLKAHTCFDDSFSPSIQRPKSLANCLESLLVGETTSAAASEPFRVIQGFIILDRIPALFHSFEQLLQAPEKVPHFPQVLRFLAHFVLLLRVLKYPAAESDDCHNILCRYVSVLMQAKWDDLISLYCSLLPQYVKVEMHAAYLRDIRGEKHRKAQFLQLASVCFFDPLELATRTVQLRLIPLIEQYESFPLESVILSNIYDEQSEMDSDHMDILDWFMCMGYEDSDFLDQLLYYSNMMIRKFLCMGKTNCAFALLSKLPKPEILLRRHSDAVSRVTQSAILSATWGDSSLDLEIKEHLDYRSLFEILTSHMEWVSLIQQKDEFYPQSKMYNEWLARFKECTTRIKERTISLAEGGWLLVETVGGPDTNKQADVNMDGGILATEDMDEVDFTTVQNRLLPEERARLHALYLPNLVLDAVQLLKDSAQPWMPENMQACFDLVNVVAALPYAWGSMKRSGVLVDFLRSIQEVAVSVVDDAERRPW